MATAKKSIMQKILCSVELATSLIDLLRDKSETDANDSLVPTYRVLIFMFAVFIQYTGNQDGLCWNQKAPGEEGSHCLPQICHHSFLSKIYFDGCDGVDGVTVES